VILALETSCDDTCAAVVAPDGTIRANVVSSQGIHDRYGGVVPEVASRHHLELVNDVVDDALSRAGASLDDVRLVAVTQGPGLIGALLVGLQTAKALAAARRLPLAPVDHLHGHVAATFLGPEPFEPPFLCLIASGGHTLLADVRDPAGFEVLGRTLDDAAGEAFDKVARVLGLPFPGGPHIDRAAREGDSVYVDFPRGLTSRRDLERHRFDFSFSGLKTAVARWVEARERSGEPVPVNDVAASFQEAVCDVLTRKAIDAAVTEGIDDILIGGGVAANSRLRAMAVERAAAKGIRVRVPRPGLCTDNGAMVAALGSELVRAGRTPSPLDLPADSSMPITEVLNR
jgi:N6-L-threonylcarbamoyladenine synthase